MDVSMVFGMLVMIAFFALTGWLVYGIFSNEHKAWVTPWVLMLALILVSGVAGVIIKALGF